MNQLFNGGALVISRLAPQDYHRWHYPVTGNILKRHFIPGDYVTVSPIAVRTTVDVYTGNHRCICPIQTKEFGLVLIIAVAATLVGAIKFTECTCPIKQNQSETTIQTATGKEKKKMENQTTIPAATSTSVLSSNSGIISFCSDGVCQLGLLKHRFNEHGWFEFGGSTVLTLFQHGAIHFDQLLAENSKNKLETLLRVGNKIGQATGRYAK